MLDGLSDAVLRGQAIQVHLEPLDRLESLMAEVHTWKESAATLFLRKDSNLTLLEVKNHINYWIKWKHREVTYDCFCAGFVSKM